LEEAGEILAFNMNESRRRRINVQVATRQPDWSQGGKGMPLCDGGGKGLSGGGGLQLVARGAIVTVGTIPRGERELAVGGPPYNEGV